MSAKRSLERRIYDAWRSGRGLRLTADDVEDLVFDDAIETRIGNAIANEAGYMAPGETCSSLWSPCGSVERFIEELRAANEGDS